MSHREGQISPILHPASFWGESWLFLLSYPQVGLGGGAESAMF